MPENNLIKSITTHSCPNCGQEMYVESQMTPPVVSALFTAQEVEDAKADCITRVEALAIEEDKKADVIKWLKDENTVFGPGEVESIILSLLKPE